MKIIFPSADTAIIPGQAVVSMAWESPNAKPTQPIVKDSQVISSLEYVPWGNANDFPQKVLEQGRKSTIIPQAMNWKANLISKKVLPFQVDFDDEGNEKLIFVRDPEILTFLNSRHMKHYVSQSANDIFWFLNIFPELILSKDRKKVTHIYPNEAAYSRIGQQNTYGVSEYAYVNANWPYASASDKETTKIRSIDPYDYDLVNWVREKHPNDYKFIYPSSYPTPGNTFYQLAHWDGIRSSGWLKVMENVPELKISLVDNQMSIPYHIQIPREYWENEYGAEWTKANASERDSIRIAKMDNIQRRMVGLKNAGIAIATEFGVSSIDGKTLEGWKIEALPDKLKDGAYLADNMEATAHLLYALGLDPTLVGFASKDMGSRSGGSDKRESLLIYLSQLDPYRDVLYEPLNFIAEYNGWLAKYPNLEFRSKQTILTTLDTGAGSKEETA